mmetsp:Transcript_20157/g.43605  ORF Transcript_20157/g.43605 Transcript_20157/m.43605 type:complete len:205 (+) Transcript_20157:1268-1882(+)
MLQAGNLPGLLRVSEGAEAAELAHETVRKRGHVHTGRTAHPPAEAAEPAEPAKSIEAAGTKEGLVAERAKERVPAPAPEEVVDGGGRGGASARAHLLQPKGAAHARLRVLLLRLLQQLLLLLQQWVVVRQHRLRLHRLRGAVRGLVHRVWRQRLLRLLRLLQVRHALRRHRQPRLRGRGRLQYLHEDVHLVLHLRVVLSNLVLQ